MADDKIAVNIIDESRRLDFTSWRDKDFRVNDGALQTGALMRIANALDRIDTKISATLNTIGQQQKIISELQRINKLQKSQIRELKLKNK